MRFRRKVVALVLVLICFWNILLYIIKQSGSKRAMTSREVFKFRTVKSDWEGLVQVNYTFTDPKTYRGPVRHSSSSIVFDTNFP